MRGLQFDDAHSEGGVPGKEQKETTTLRRRLVRSPLLRGAPQDELSLTADQKYHSTNR
jgi:hypothetical protein